RGSLHWCRASLGRGPACCRPRSESTTDPEGGDEPLGERLLEVPLLGEVPVELETEEVGSQAPAVRGLRSELVVQEVVVGEVPVLPELEGLPGVVEPRAA